MKSKLMRIIFVLMSMLIIGTLSGCSIGMDSLDDILDKNNLSAQITYYSNGGWFNNDTESLSRNIYYKENSKAFQITDTTQTKVKHSEYLYDGWYTVERVEMNGKDCFVCDIQADQTEEYTLEDTTVIVEFEGKYVMEIADYEELLKTANVPLLALDTPFDFTNERLAKGDKIYLACKWIPNQKVDYVLLTEGCTSVTVENNDGTTKVVHNGEIIASETFDTNGIYTVPTNYRVSPVDTQDSTFIDYYVYSENPDLNNLERLADKTAKLEKPEDGSNIKVFVKYIAGTWKVIRFGEDVKNIFTSPNNNYYLSRDVDCADLPVQNTVDGVFRGKISGNGYTISGIKAKAERLGGGSEVALFGMMAEGAIIENITFKDVSFTCTTKPSANIKVYLLAYELRDDAVPTLTNVTFDGVTVDITLASEAMIENIPATGASFDKTKWFCAGYTNEEFLTAFDSFKIENYQLNITKK